MYSKNFHAHIHFVALNGCQIIVIAVQFGNEIPSSVSAFD